MAANGSEFHLRQTDATDREILGLLKAQVEDDGYANSAAVAAALWPTVMSNGNLDGQRKAVRAVGSRLSWLRRVGVVERRSTESGSVPSGPRRWALTAEGEALLRGRLNAGTTRAIESLDGVQTVLAVHAITDKETGEMVSTLMRRAWNYGQAAR
jgi:hypothetical protein